MKNRKGFTLVELLVVIVILGIITGISIPLIRNIQEKNRMKKFTTYMDSVKASAKLYVDSYEEDLFGHEKSGCAIIYYSQLEDKKIIKDIAVDGVSCNTKDTFVKVIKVDDKISYSPAIGCGEVDNTGTVKVETKLPEGGIIGVDTCGIDTKTIVGFSATPVSSNSINYKKRNIIVNAVSNTGFLEDYDISYGYVKDGEKPSDINQDPPISDWNKLEFNYIGANKQKQEIEKGNAIVLNTPKYQTPDNVTGDYYLVIRINHLRDLGGRNWTTDLNQSKYYYFGTYRVDNTKPVFSNTSTVVSSNDNYNHIKPKLNISVTDNYSSSGDLRMCISYDRDTCPKEVKKIKDKTNGWISYDKDKVLDKIQDEQDGSTHKVYVSVADAAGNYETESYDYLIDKRVTITYDSTGGTSCSPASKTVTATDPTTKWGTLCSGIRKDNYTFTGWNTKKDGTGERITKDSFATSDITVYAQWRKNRVIFQYKVMNGENLTSRTTDNGTVYNWTKNSNNIIQKNGIIYHQYVEYDERTMNIVNYNNPKYLEIKKTGYEGKSGAQWKCDSGCKNGTMTFSQGNSSVTPKNICDYKDGDCTVTLKVNWVASAFDITYTLNGGSLPSGKSNPSSYTVETPTFTLVNPERSGYTFKGWTGSNGSTPETTVKISKGSTGNRTYTANWALAAFTITYHYDGGSSPSTGVPSSYSPGVGATINGRPTKNGFTFNGWSDNSSLTGAAFSKTIGTSATGNKDFYAKWCKNCSSVANGSCSLNADTAGTCSYSTSCNSCYSLTSGSNTSNPICKDNSSPTANAWVSTYLSHTNVRLDAGRAGPYTLNEPSVASTRIQNLGNDCGDGLNKIYYKLSCMSSYKSSSIGANGYGYYADIAVNACGENPSLIYYLEDKAGNKSDTITVPNIGLYFLYGMFYNKVLHPTPPAGQTDEIASNSNENLGYQVSITPVIDEKYNPAAITYGKFTVLANITHRYSNGELVTMMYNAHLGREPEPEGYNSWLNHLDQGDMSRSTFFHEYCLAPSNEPRALLKAWGYDDSCLLH